MIVARTCCSGKRHISRLITSRGLAGATSQAAVFDRALKRRQRQASILAPGSDDYDYLRKEVAERMVDRLDDITRSFPVALDLSCHKGHIMQSLLKRESLVSPGDCAGGIKTLVMCDSTQAALDAVPLELVRESGFDLQTHLLEVDEETLPFEEASYDLVLCSLGLHWVNDIPATLRQIRLMLKPDGVFIGCLLGGETLHELKRSFYLAEQERRGGLSFHISPMVKPSDVAGLLQGAGFTLPTIDVDTIQVGYASAFTLMEHLGGMGESTAALHRHYSVGAETMLAMAAIYQQEYGLPDGEGDGSGAGTLVPATFQVIYMIGWSPDSSQPQPLAPGCGQKSLKEELERKPAA
jgi:NADH dehydrogenase [ubiquinone] 1 alpha subcomplex assembly factor 5